MGLNSSKEATNAQIPIMQCYCGCIWTPSTLFSGFVCPGCGRMDDLLLVVMA